MKNSTRLVFLLLVLPNYAANAFAFQKPLMHHKITQTHMAKSSADENNLGKVAAAIGLSLAIFGNASPAFADGKRCKHKRIYSV